MLSKSRKFQAVAMVIPSFSPAAFPSQHGIIAHVGGGSYSGGPDAPPKLQAKLTNAVRFTDAKNLQPLGFASVVVPAVSESESPSHILSVPRPEDSAVVDEAVLRMRRALRGSEAEGRDDDDEREDGEKLYFVLTGVRGLGCLFCEVDLFLRRAPPVVLENRSAPCAVGADTVTFETMYEQECSFAPLWRTGRAYRGRACLVASPRKSTKTLLASVGADNLDLLDVWNGGTQIRRIPVKTYAFGVCYHSQTNRVFIAGDRKVVAVDLSKGETEWDAARSSEINPKGYELFSIATPPPTAVAWENGVFVGAHGRLSVLDARTDAAPVLHRDTNGYVRQIAFSDRLLCYLHGGRVSVCDLRMLRREGCDDVGIDVHVLSKDGRDGDIVPLPNECFVSVPPLRSARRTSTSTGMTKWSVSQGGRAKILKETNWPGKAACFFPRGFTGYSSLERVEMEERIRFSLSCDCLRLLTLRFGVARITVSRSFL